MKKRNCRMTDQERERHERATKIRKMTDDQICDLLDELNDRPAKAIENLLYYCGLRDPETDLRISDATIRKIRQIAVSRGFLLE